MGVQMARKRTLSPAFFTHGELYDAEAACRLPLRLVFAALWCQADRRGIFEWKSRELKLVCLPYDPIDFDAALSALESAGFLVSYVVKGRRYGVIPTFNRWQGFHKDERPSDAPSPSSADAVSAADADSARGQHRATTVPPRGQHGINRPVTVTVTSTVTGTVIGSQSRAGSVPSDDDGRSLTDDALLLTTAANAGISQRYGEQPVPIHHGHPGGMQVAEALRAAGISVEYAHAVIFTAAAALTNDRPPRSVKYFLGLVLDRWHAEQARTAAASYTPTTQPAAPEVDQMRTFAARYARDGSAEWQAYCDERQIPWEVAA